MFDSGLDTEHTFGQASVVARTRGRRRRFAGGVLLVGALSLSAPVVASGVAGGSPRGTDAADRYVVRAGDTLWDIARERAPDRDPRDVVQAIVDANQIDAGALLPGQVLVIPA